MAGVADLKEFIHDVLFSFSLETWVDYIGEWCISRGGTLVVLYFGLFASAAYSTPEFLPLIFGWLIGTLPIWAPIAAIGTFSKVWMWYVQALFILKRTNGILLEVKIPKEITKSPRAMEQVFVNLWIRSAETTFIDRAWGGGLRPYFSFELASFGGEVHMFIWTRKSYKNLIESNMYAQYPEVELHEVEDYASRFQFDPKKHESFVTEYRLEPLRDGMDGPEARQNAYPIRTYVDFELDQDPKEEHKVEPIAQVFEMLSSLKSHEQVWIQMIIRSHLDVKDWKGLVLKEIDRLRAESATISDEALEAIHHNFEKRAPMPRPAWRHQEMMKSMERNLGKLPFDFVGRAIYFAPEGKMDSVNFTAMRWIWRPFANPHFMSMWRPRRYHNVFDFPWQDFRGKRAALFTKRGLDAFRRRSAFFSPWTVPHNVQSVEVLATLWHPPSSTVRSPGLQRLPSKKSEPPPNLPQ